MKTLLCHPGTQHSFRLARQLERQGLLYRFRTGLAYTPDSVWGACLRRLPGPIQRKLSNRKCEGVSRSKIWLRPVGELRALLRLRAGEDGQQVLFERNAAFQRNIPRRELLASDVVIGFDTSSWLLAERSAAARRAFVLDRTIGHPRSFDALTPQIQRQFPEWNEELRPRLPAMVKAQDMEHELATRIVVPSSFVRRTLIENGVPSGKIVTIPFGVDLETFRPASGPEPGRPLRFLFLGSLSARKGLPVLLKAWTELAGSDAELWLVGPCGEKQRQLIPPLEGLRVIGKVPHRELPQLLRMCDVLVLPSFFEGLALVQLEALASGLPVIATEESGALDLIADGREGYIVPAGDAEALRQALQRAICRRADLPTMSAAARVRAEQFSWNAYGDRWKTLLDQVR